MKETVSDNTVVRKRTGYFFKPVQGSYIDTAFGITNSRYFFKGANFNSSLCHYEMMFLSC